MDLGPSRRRTTTDSTIPLINIVFLMLIFFLFAGTVSRDDAREIAPPVDPAAEEAIRSTGALVIDRTGALSRDGEPVTLDEVLMSLGKGLDESVRLVIAADGRLSVDELKPVLRRLSQSGASLVLLTEKTDR
jgi:biopolymer transport protein ExbD